ncbi:hypothetical protein [Hahella sp. CCB-MM4]|uniref:hypothetical protein n=1 Tax=Hahella sp. (strain CCB-MM4) TaxID=1926491 RepID=UPI00143CF5D3|nr:hypothetical protein [Hahella sp. CCB-MM4]
MAHKDTDIKNRAVKQPEALTVHELEEIKVAMCKARKVQETQGGRKVKGFNGHGS